METIYGDIGNPNWECQHCGALMWYQERKEKSRNSCKPKFQMCCGGGNVQLPLLEQPPRTSSEAHISKPWFRKQKLPSKCKNIQCYVFIYISMYEF